MAILRQAIRKDRKNAILIALASICVGVWLVGLGLLCGVVGSLKSPDLYQLGLLGFAAGFVGVLMGFVASVPSPMKHGDEKVELEGGIVSETGKWVSSAIAGGSLTAIALEGKKFLVWLVLHFLSSTTMPPSYSRPGACRCRSTHKAWLSTRYDTR